MLFQALAIVEERCRVRLHQAANRMEDYDPIEVKAAEGGIKFLNLVDRVTGFRQAHKGQDR